MIMLFNIVKWPLIVLYTILQAGFHYLISKFTGRKFKSDWYIETSDIVISMDESGKEFCKITRPGDSSVLETLKRRLKK